MTASVLEIVGIIIFYIFFNTLGSIDHVGQKQKLLVLTGVRDNQSAWLNGDWAILTEAHKDRSTRVYTLYKHKLP